MAIKLKIPRSKPAAGQRFLSRDPVIRAALLAFLTLAITITAVFSFFYVKYDRIIEEKFRGQIFSNSAKIYSIPQAVRVGEKIEAREIAAQLRRAGYSERDGQSRLARRLRTRASAGHRPVRCRTAFQARAGHIR